MALPTASAASAGRSPPPIRPRPSPLRELLRLRYEAALAPAVEAASTRCRRRARHPPPTPGNPRRWRPPPPSRANCRRSCGANSLPPWLLHSRRRPPRPAGTAPSGLPEAPRLGFHYLVTGDLPWFEAARRRRNRRRPARRGRRRERGHRPCLGSPGGGDSCWLAGGRGGRRAPRPLLDGPAVAAWLDHAVARAGWSRTAAPVGSAACSRPARCRPSRRPRADRLQALVLAWALAATAAPAAARTGASPAALFPPSPLQRRWLRRRRGAGRFRGDRHARPGRRLPAREQWASGGAAPVLLPSAAAPTDENAAAHGCARRRAGPPHPFLERCFTTLGLPPAPRRHSPRRAPRPQPLLHWLATGRDEAYEFELGTIKVLLGLTPADPLPPVAGLLGDGEREEGGALARRRPGPLGRPQEHQRRGLRLPFLQRRPPRPPRRRLAPAARTRILRSPRAPALGYRGSSNCHGMTRPLFTEWPMG